MYPRSKNPDLGHPALAQANSVQQEVTKLLQ
jgi:hypothetical protein